jgi:hypothetical protein
MADLQRARGASTPRYASNDRRGFHTGEAGGEHSRSAKTLAISLNPEGEEGHHSVVDRLERLHRAPDGNPLALRQGLIGTLIGLLPSDVSTAQEDRRRFRIHGYVQWIAGTKLMLLAGNGAPIAIDLTESDQGQ